MLSTTSLPIHPVLVVCRRLARAGLPTTVDNLRKSLGNYPDAVLRRAREVLAAEGLLGGGGGKPTARHGQE